MQEYSILQNDLWKSRGWFIREYIDTHRKTFIIYTVPYALSYDHALHNHTFIAAQQRDSVDLKTYEVLSWKCTIPDPLKVVQSLQGLSQARHLHWNFDTWVRLYSFPNNH
jgi:hypothetical protein